MSYGVLVDYYTILQYALPSTVPSIYPRTSSMRTPDRPPHRWKRRLLIAAASVPVLIFAYVTVGLWIVHRVNHTKFSYHNAGTDLTFESSDRIWIGDEDLLRGRHFEQVLFDFELFRIRCQKPQASLLRTKPRKRPWNWAYWFDDYQELKWRVPYSIPVARRTQPACAKGKATSSQMSQAQLARLLYLEHLSAHEAPERPCNSD